MPDADSSARDSRGTAPTVVFIAGSGRSGSTLLERTLGAIPGYVAIGEALDLPRRVAPDDELCGCGRPFASCPFWSAVGGRIGGWDRAWLADMHTLQTEVARQRHLPRLLGAPRRGAFAAKLDDYTSRYAALYQAVSDVSGCRYVVDASKWPALALALYRGGIDVRVVHLVRDVRGVALSLSSRTERPHTTGSGELMYSNPPASAAARWLATQTEVDSLRLARVPVTRMRYADFVSDPAVQVAGALHGLGMPAADLSHIDGRIVRLGPAHGLSGNPSRFRHGDIPLRPDDRWREQMSRRDRIVTTAVALPQVLRVGRGLSLRPAASPEPAASATAGPGAPPTAEAVVSTVWPTLTAIVPTRGRPELVREAVRSVVVQDYPGEIECLVVHDREAPDPTLAELARPGRSVQVLVNLHKPGLAGARNTGLDCATGSFVAGCDDDDIWLPGKTTAQIRRMLAEPDLLAVGSGLRLRISPTRVDEWLGRAPHVESALLLRNRVKELHSSTLLMRRDAFAKAGYYDEDLPGGYGEDWDIVLRLSRVGHIGLVKEPLAEIKKDGGSYYIGKADRTVVALQAFLARHPEIRTSRRGYARIMGQLAFQYAALGDRSKAAATAAKAAGSWPLSPYPYVAVAQILIGADPQRMQKAARFFGRGMA